MKKILLGVFSLALFTACKNETKEEATTTDVIPFAELLDNYYEDGLKLNPLNATMAGDNRYNDQFPNVLSPEYKAKAKDGYNVTKLLSNGMTNAKTSKNEIKTFILYIAPYNQNNKGINLCPKASAGCAAACLFSAGRGKFSNVKQARINKARQCL